MKSRATIPVLMICCGLAVSGCSLLNPHVIWERPDATEVVTLQSAIKYANDAKDAYKTAIGEQAMLTSSLGLGLIPLSAAALGLGIANVDGNAITALGLTGAAAFSATTWVGSKPRQRVYIAGIKAMTCAVDAMIPLNFPQQDQTDLKNDLDTLNGAIRVAQGKVTAINKFTNMIEEQEGGQPLPPNVPKKT